MASKPAGFILPNTVVGPAELGRLKRELEDLHDNLHQAGLRAKASSKPADETIAASQSLTKLAEANGLDIKQKSDRQSIIKELTDLAESAPTVTISFAVDPSADFMTKIVEWFRANTHPSVLVRVSLQPNITAGCRLRTPGKLYDFSLRGKFDEQRSMLIRRLRESGKTQTNLKAPTVEATT